MPPSPPPSWSTRPKTPPNLSPSTILCHTHSQPPSEDARPRRRARAKAEEEAPNTSSAPYPWPGSSTTAELEEGLRNDTATMEGMDCNRQLAEGQVFLYNPAQEEAFVEWFQDILLLKPLFIIAREQICKVKAIK